jgi:nicotinamidase-related amidase
MHALVVVDAQNEFSPAGLRPVPNHASALVTIREWVARARQHQWPIAWVRHHNKPHESRAFVPGTWGAQLSPGLEPGSDVRERLFEKDVFGAFTYTGLEDWLRAQHVSHLVVVGFYTHMCVSTTVREGLIRGFEVAVDPEGTGARELEHDQLGRLSADEVRRSALLHVFNMGATLAVLDQVAGEVTAAEST